MWRLRPPLGPSPVELDDSGDELPVHKRQRRESSHPAAQASAAPFWQHASIQEDVTTALAAQGAAHGGVCLHLPPDIDEADDPFSLCAVERHSVACLHRRWVSFEQLNDMLPTITACRHESVALPIREDRKSIITFGAYVQGPLTGLRSPTKRYPMTTRLLNAVVYTMAGPCPHITLFLARNMSAGLHADVNNANTPNILIPLSVFDGGHLFIEDKEGVYQLDADGLQNICDPAVLELRCLRATPRPTLVGLILEAYHVRNADRLPHHSRQCLKSLHWRRLH